MKKNRLTLLILRFAGIFLAIIMAGLYIWNPMKKNYIFPKSMILPLTAIISAVISALPFWKSEIMRILFQLLVLLILTILYFVM